MRNSKTKTLPGHSRRPANSTRQKYYVQRGREWQAGEPRASRQTARINKPPPAAIATDSISPRKLSQSHPPPPSQPPPPQLPQANDIFSPALATLRALSSRSMLAKSRVYTEEHKSQGSRRRTRKEKGGSCCLQGTKGGWVCALHTAFSQRAVADPKTEKSLRSPSIGGQQQRTQDHPPPRPTPQHPYSSPTTKLWTKHEGIFLYQRNEPNTAVIYCRGFTA